MNDLQIFGYEEQQVRTIQIDGNPWFVGRDVATILGYKDSVNAIKSHCRGVAKHHPLQTAGGVQKVRVISEPDVYRLVANSTLPSAEKFEVWIFEEVIPSIRKTGSYGMDPIAALNDPATMRQMLLVYAERAIEQEKTIEQQRPKVLALDRLATANGSICITDAAKNLQIHPIKRLFQWMSFNDWIYKRAGGRGNWLAYQRRIKQGVLEHKIKPIPMDDGTEKTTFQVLVTPKGLSVLAQIFEGKDNIFA